MDTLYLGAENHLLAGESRMTKYRLSFRELTQVIASLRYWGRVAETSADHPSTHPMIAARFRANKRNEAVKVIPPLTLDELETLIGRLDGTWTGRGLRTWNPWRYL
jgi:hypothetical protein